VPRSGPTQGSRDRHKPEGVLGLTLRKMHGGANGLKAPVRPTSPTFGAPGTLPCITIACAGQPSLALSPPTRLPAIAAVNVNWPSSRLNR
jgi:hypothetical protein